jgi:hypothetical protein
MLEVYGAAARGSEARQRSAGKGKRKAQLSAAERAAHVKRYRESGAPSATAYVVGKSAKPRCYKFAEEPPLPYTSQQRAWFDRMVTEWWVQDVFVPHVRKVHGDVWVVLILDNCPAHPCNDVDKFHHHKVFIIFLPKNMTSRFQPADMGMISALKKRYKSIYLRKLVSLCDDDEAYATAKRLGMGMQSGTAGLAYANKPHILDAMEILHKIWNDDQLTTTVGLVRCWRKANCLPPPLTALLVSEAGSRAVVSNGDDHGMAEICSAMTAFVSSAAGMEGGVPELLEDSIVQQGLPGGFGHEEFTAMMQMWAVVEDLPEVVNAEVGDAIEELTQLALIPHVVAVKTGEVLEEEEPPKEPPEMSDVEQALIALMDGLHQEHCGQQQAARALHQSADEDPE